MSGSTYPKSCRGLGDGGCCRLSRQAVYLVAQVAPICIKKMRALVYVVWTVLYLVNEVTAWCATRRRVV